MAIARAEYDLFARDRTRPAFESAIRNQQRYNRGFRDTARASRRSTRVVNTDLRSTSTALAAVTGRLKTFVFALGAGLAGAAGVRALSALEQIRDTAVGLDTTAQSVARLTLAFEQFNVSGATAATLFQKINARIEEARQGVAGATDIFQRLGLDPETLAQANLENRIGAIFEALSQLDELGRSRAGKLLFEESFARIAPLVAGGSAALRDMASEADNLLGPIDAAAEASKRITGEFTNAKTSVVGLGAELIRVLENPIISAAKAAQELAINTREFFATAREGGVVAALARDLALAAGETGAAILENVTGLKLFNREAAKATEVTEGIARATGQIQDFRAQRRAQADIGIVRRNAERVTTEERVNELTDERLDTQLRILQILDRQRETVTARTGVSIGRGEALPGDLRPTAPDRLTGQIERLEEERANRELVELTRKLVQIAEEQKEQGVTLN